MSTDLKSSSSLPSEAPISLAGGSKADVHSKLPPSPADQLQAEIKNIVSNSYAILEKTLQEVEGMALIKQEVKFLKDLVDDLEQDLALISLVVKDDADGSLVLRIAKLEGYINKLQEDSGKQTKSLSVIAALVTAIASLVSQILTYLLGSK
jgi:hypothetical protein